MRKSDCNPLFSVLSIILLITEFSPLTVFQLNGTSNGHVHFMTIGVGLCCSTYSPFSMISLLVDGLSDIIV